MSVKKNIYYTFLAQIPTFCLIFFTNLFITLIVKAEGKGVLSIFQADIDLFVLFLSFAITTAIVFFVSSNTIKLEKLFAIGLLIIGVGLVILLIFLSISSAFFSNSFVFPNNYSELFHYLYLIVSFFLVSFNSLILSFFQGKSNFRVINSVSIFNGCLNFVVFGILFLLYRYYNVEFKINDILVISLLLVIVNFIIHIILFQRYINLWPDFNFSYKNDVKKVFVFISLGHIAYMVNFITYKVDYWILEYYKGVGELGLYSQAVGMAQMFWYVSTPIATVMSPYLTSQQGDESITTLKFFLRVNFSITLILLLAASIFADFIFPIYGNQFSNSVLSFRIISIGILMASASKVLAAFVIARNKIKYNLIASIIGMVITIILDMVLIPLYGKIGASIATSISYSSVLITVMIFIKYKFGVNLNNMFFVTKNDVCSIKEKINRMLNI